MFEAINGPNITMSFGVISFSANVRPNGFIFNTSISTQFFFLETVENYLHSSQENS